MFRPTVLKAKHTGTHALPSKIKVSAGSGDLDTGKVVLINGKVQVISLPPVVTRNGLVKITCGKPGPNRRTFLARPEEPVTVFKI